MTVDSCLMWVLVGSSSEAVLGFNHCAISPAPLSLAFRCVELFSWMMSQLEDEVRVEMKQGGCDSHDESKVVGSRIYQTSLSTSADM